MAWFEKKTEKAAIPQSKELWVTCPRCKKYFAKSDWTGICTECGYHGRMKARARIALLADEGSFKELFTDVSYSDHLNFKDATGTYKAKVEATIAKTGESESIVIGTAEMGKVPVMLGVMDFAFMGGSLGTGTGERICLAAEQAIAERRPLVLCSASGGARMHEGILSLIAKPQMCVGNNKDTKRIRNGRRVYPYLLSGAGINHIVPGLSGISGHDIQQCHAQKANSPSQLHWRHIFALYSRKIMQR